MNKRDRRARPVFADIVNEAKNAPSLPSPPPPSLIAPDGNCFFRTGRSLAPDEAVDLVAAGAIVAWDSCGCLGYCDIDWFAASDQAELVRTGPPELRQPTKRRNRGHGELTEWQTCAGDTLVLASQDVRWGRFMY